MVVLGKCKQRHARSEPDVPSALRSSYPRCLRPSLCEVLEALAALLGCAQPTTSSKEKPPTQTPGQLSPLPLRWLTRTLYVSNSTHSRSRQTPAPACSRPPVPGQGPPPPERVTGSVNSVCTSGQHLSPPRERRSAARLCYEAATW